MKKELSNATAPMIESEIVSVGRDLARTLSSVLNALPGAPHRPQWLSRLLGVNTVLTSRVIKAAGQQDPLAVAHMVPGPEPLRRLLRAAERKKVDDTLIGEAQAAVDAFERLIDQVAGDRSALDAIISGWLPDARDHVEMIAKQSVFRGISQLLGAACDVTHFAALLYPSASARDRVDQVWLVINRGLRRVRPGLIVKFDSVHSSTPLLTVAGTSVENLDGLFLEQFCSKPLPRFEVSRLGNRAQYALAGDDVGVQSGVDLVHATLLPGKKERHRSRDDLPRKTAVSIGVDLPTRILIFDLLLHESVFPGQQPSFGVYRTEADGVVDPNDASREIDRLDVLETLQPLGIGIAKFRAAEAPGYQDMLRYVCEQRGWDTAKLRGFRCKIEYPVYSSQIVMAFDLPIAPA